MNASQNVLKPPNMVSQPPNMSINLFPHQLHSIFRMENLENNNFIQKQNCIKQTKIGINADISGFGKTLSMIGLICRDKMSWNVDLPFVFETIISESAGRVKIFKQTNFAKLPSTLILVSSTILNQWVMEIRKTTLTYKSITIRKDLDNLQIQNFDIILVTPSMYNTLIEIYEKYAWKRFIYDEPAYLKIVNMKDVYAGFYWFVTANPEMIFDFHKKSKGFIRDLMYPGFSDTKMEFLSDITIKNQIDFVKSSFVLPNNEHYFYECDQQLYTIINKYISLPIKKMIEADDISGAIEALGCDIKTSNIFQLVKEKKEKEFNEINDRLAILLSDTEPCSDMLKKIEVYQQKKIKIQNEIDEIHEKYQNVLNNDCLICFDVLNKPVMEPACQNLFCGQCILTWMVKHNSCPMCRENIEIPNLIYINNEETIKNNRKPDICIKKSFTKIEKIIDLVKSKPDGKFLIFSEYPNTFIPLRMNFFENHFNFVEIKGTIKNKEHNIELFKTGHAQIIFINSMLDCVGLNLTETTDIILYHQLDLATKNQVIGRCNRLGRIETLKIHHLINDSIEREIFL